MQPVVKFFLKNRHLNYLRLIWYCKCKKIDIINKKLKTQNIVKWNTKRQTFIVYLNP